MRDRLAYRIFNKVKNALCHKYINGGSTFNQQHLLQLKTHNAQYMKLVDCSIVTMKYC